MHVLGKDWQDGYFDYRLSAGEAGIAVGARLKESVRHRPVIAAGIGDIAFFANGVAVKMENSGRYVSENVHRIIRTKRINKLSVLPRMQRTTFRKILNGEPGDSTESIQRSAELVPGLEEMYQSPRGRRPSVTSERGGRLESPQETATNP